MKSRLFYIALILLVFGILYPRSTIAESHVLKTDSEQIDKILLSIKDNNFKEAVNNSKNYILRDQASIIDDIFKSHSLAKHQKYNLSAMKSLLNTVIYKSNHNNATIIWYPVYLDSKNSFNNKFPQIGDVGHKLTVTMLQNAIEPLSFALQNFSGDVMVESISIELLKKNNDNFPESHVNYKVVKNWYVGNDYKIEVDRFELSHPILVNELLLNDDSLVYVNHNDHSNYLRISSNGVESYINISSPNILMPNDAKIYDSIYLKPFNVPSAEARQIWMSLDTNGLSSGRYNGYVNITYNLQGEQKNKIMKIPLEVNVLSTSLASSSVVYGVYYAGQLRSNTLDATQKDESQYIVELQDIKNHGVLYPTIYINGDYNGPDDESTIAKYLQLRESVGLPCDKLYFVNVNQQPDKIIPMLKSIVKKNTSCKNSKLYIYGVDEAYGSKLQSEIPKFDQIHELGGYVFASSTKEDAFDIAGNYIDTLIYRNMLVNSDSNIVNEFRENGKDVFLYGNPQSGIPDPYLYRSGYGFYLIKNNYSGAMDFAYQINFPGKYSYDHGVFNDDRCIKTKGYYCSAWNRFSSNIYYNHMFTFPTSNGVVGTLQWEGYASSLNDVKYYNSLLELCGTNKCNVNQVHDLIDVNHPTGSRMKIIQQIESILDIKSG